ncbi:hypothetical protein PROFUN_04674 [Planoprotostelium fungivorum]|uniref:Microbial-type PARG catalytic domain-containing protein n=1 Tax=Planoprotostelium fungivorum TaxID=1890364 RepID=A0A2P6NUK1_9EUKA|nr:hypothetical protein PROFUN_04674 [Planoprotostelium fungivorum]
MKHVCNFPSEILPHLDVILISNPDIFFDSTVSTGAITFINLFLRETSPSSESQSEDVTYTESCWRNEVNLLHDSKSNSRRRLHRSTIIIWLIEQSFIRAEAITAKNCKTLRISPPQQRVLASADSTSTLVETQQKHFITKMSNTRRKKTIQHGKGKRQRAFLDLLFEGTAARHLPFGILAPCGGEAKSYEEVFPELYARPECTRASETIRRTIFSDQQWTIQKQKFHDTKQFGLIKNLRQLVQRGTIEACLRGMYWLPDGKSVSLSQREMIQSAETTRMYHEDHPFVSVIPRKRKSSRESVTTEGREKREESDKGEEMDREEKTKEEAPISDRSLKISVVQGDCLTIAMEMTANGRKPAILNMASLSHPGGGWEHGAGAQEENLFRRTNLFQCLSDPYQLDQNRNWEYPMPEYGGIHTPHALVFRREESEGYAFMEHPMRFPFISVAAVRRPHLVFQDEHSEPIMSHPDETSMRRKIRTILNIAAQGGHVDLVLSAFGCGAYGCPPRHVARIFFDEISRWPKNSRPEGQYGEFRFEEIVFAIFDDKNTGMAHNPQGNLVPFQFEMERWVICSAVDDEYFSGGTRRMPRQNCE